MTVEKLIDKLLSENPQRKVVVDGYEAGFDEVEEISYVNIKPSSNKKEDAWWNGEFGLSNNPDDEIAILLPRKS